jgi:hypothetical protein
MLEMGVNVENLMMIKKLERPDPKGDELKTNIADIFEETSKC